MHGDMRKEMRSQKSSEAIEVNDNKPETIDLTSVPMDSATEAERTPVHKCENTTEALIKFSELNLPERNEDPKAITNIHEVVGSLFELRNQKNTETANGLKATSDASSMSPVTMPHSVDSETQEKQALCVLMSKRRLKTSEEDHSKLKNMKHMLSSGKFEFKSKIAKDLIAEAIVFALTLSTLIAEIIILIIFCASLFELGISVKVKEIVAFSLSRNSLTSLLSTTTTDSLCHVRAKIANKKLFLSCDVANKGSLHHNSKIVLHCDDVKVSSFQLDSDSYLGTHVGTAQGIDNSMKKFDSTTGIKKTLEGEQQILEVAALVSA